jgi:hypothetical protein
MHATYNRQLFRFIGDFGTVAVLENIQARERIEVGYDDPLLLVDPTDDDVESLRKGTFHHLNEWGSDVCCSREALRSS